MHTVCFSTIGVAQNGVDLTQINVTGYDEGACIDMVYVQLLDSAGISGPQYQYIDLDGEFEAGWYDDSFEPIAAGDVILPVGQGLWTTGADGISFIFDGKVIDVDVTVALRNGATACGNMMAVPVDIQDVIVSGYDEGACIDMVYAQILDNAGVSGPQYQYIDLDGEFEAGWYDDGFEKLETGAVMLPAGQGLWVTGADGLYFTFPAPEGL